MKKKLVITAAMAALMTVAIAGAADAQHRGGGFHGGGFHGGIRGGGFRGGVFFGGPFYDPFWFGPNWAFPGPAYYSPYPYYYYPPYTDYGPDSAAPPSQGWYYCSNPRGYYPEVPNCHTQWQYVPPRP